MERLIELYDKGIIKRGDILRFITAAKPLHSAVSLKEVFNRSVRAGVIISGCARCCVIIRNKREEFILKNGAPEGGHKIGQITHGKGFLKEILKNGKYKLITNPSKDGKVAYMSGLIKTHGITSILLLPLLYGDDELGLVIFDRTDEKKFSKSGLEQLKVLAKYIARGIWREYKRKFEEEESIRDANLRVLGQNSAAIAHSLRNPLVSIGGFARRMDKKLSDENQINKGAFGEYCRMIVSEVNRMEAIIKDVLVFTGVTTQKIKLEPCFLNDFLRDTVRLFVENHGAAKLKVRFSLDPRLNRTRIKIDRNMMKSALEDIVRNAVEAGASVIKVKTKIKGKKRLAMITLANNGGPIDSEMIDKVFDPFMTTKSNGTGLGLPNVRAIIEAHRGQIGVKSKGNSKAKYETKFKWSIPLSKTST